MFQPNRRGIVSVQVFSMIRSSRQSAAKVPVSLNDPGSQLTVRVEVAAGSDGAAAKSASDALAGDIKTMIGVTATIDLQEAGAVARSMGKAQRVIDKR